MASCHTHAATKPSSHRSFWRRRASHRIHRIHRNEWRKIFSHGFHGCAQIRRVWHPCHTHAAHQTIFPQKSQNLTQPNHLWTSVKSVGGYPLPEASVNSVNSVGGLQRVAWVWQDAIPSYKNSHRLHGCAQIRRQKRNLKICGHL